MKPGTLRAIIVFTLVAVAHLLRPVTGAPVTIGESAIPQWISIVGVFVPGLIAWLLWRESG